MVFWGDHMVFLGGSHGFFGGITWFFGGITWFFWGERKEDQSSPTEYKGRGGGGL